MRLKWYQRASDTFDLFESDYMLWCVSLFFYSCHLNFRDYFQCVSQYRKLWLGAPVHFAFPCIWFVFDTFCDCISWCYSPNFTIFFPYFIFARIVLCLVYFSIFFFFFSLLFLSIHVGMQRSFCSHPRSSTTLRMSIQVNEEEKKLLLRLNFLIYMPQYITFFISLGSIVARTSDSSHFVSFRSYVCMYVYDLQLMIITFSIWFDLPLPPCLHQWLLVIIVVVLVRVFLFLILESNVCI